MTGNSLRSDSPYIGRVKPNRNTIQDAFVKNLTQNTGVERATAKAVLKRKVGYTEEQVSTTRAKLSEMDIDKDRDIEEVDNELNGQ